ncbi:hypothetical protein LG3211_5377 [Lysobacter gummosus]|nr:hypothetical protein LG3211_5377 [Lysobacter gummosus]
MRERLKSLDFRLRGNDEQKRARRDLTCVSRERHAPPHPKNTKPALRRAS